MRLEAHPRADQAHGILEPPPVVDRVLHGQAVQDDPVEGDVDRPDPLVEDVQVPLLDPDPALLERDGDPGVEAADLVAGRDPGLDMAPYAPVRSLW